MENVGYVIFVIFLVVTIVCFFLLKDGYEEYSRLGAYHYGFPARNTSYIGSPSKFTPYYGYGQAFNRGWYPSIPDLKEYRGYPYYRYGPYARGWYYDNFIRPGITD